MRMKFKWIGRGRGDRGEENVIAMKRRRTREEDGDFFHSLASLTQGHVFQHHQQTVRLEAIDDLVQTYEVGMT
jgi:hypothetical protein